MGLTPFPFDTVLRLATVAGADVFIETGTFHGNTAVWAAEHFRAVYTVEVGLDRYKVTSQALRGFTNISCLHGDSRVALLGLLAALQGQRKVFYLDGHWSGEGTDGEQDQCPLLGELALLSKEDIILIDDARLFIEGVVPPLNPAQWPSFSQVLDAIPEGSHVAVIGDVIFAVPQACASALHEATA